MPPRSTAVARRPTEESSGDSDDDDDDRVLAAFSTRSTGKPKASAAKKAPAKANAAAKPTPGSASPTQTGAPSLSSRQLMPYVGKIDLEDVELCTEEGASLERHLEDADKLLRAFEGATTKHEPLIARAVAKVEERLTAQFDSEKRNAVEAATMAAIRTTELRMNVELRNAVAEAVADAVAEAREAAKVAQEKAVEMAVRLTEERCKEQQRLAVGNVQVAMKREVGRPEEEIAAASAQFNFREASTAAAAAMEAAAALLGRDAEEAEQGQKDATPAAAVDVSEEDGGAGEGTAAAEEAADQPPAAAGKEDPLQFF